MRLFQLSEEGLIFCFLIRKSVADTHSYVTHISLPSDLELEATLEWLIVHPRAELHAFLMLLHTKGNSLSLVSSR